MEFHKNNGPATSVSNKSGLGSFYRRIKRLSPLPYVAKARHYYVASIIKCAGMSSYSGIAVTAAPKMAFTTSSSRNDDEFAEFLRSESQKSSFSVWSSGGLMSTSQSNFHVSLGASTPPSMGRIDEERPCYFPASFRKSVDQVYVRFRHRSRVAASK